MKKFAFLILSLVNAVLTAVYVALSPLEIVPMHYNINGVADSYSSKWFVMFMPCILIVLGIVYLIYSFVAQHHEKMLKNQKYVGRIVLGIYLFFIILFWYLTVTCISGATKMGNAAEYILSAALGALMLFISNMLPKVKQNKTLGIRIPATLSSETVWKKTHKLGGYLGVISGSVMVILAIVGMIFSLNGMAVLFGGLGLFLVVACIIPCIYAQVLYSKEKKANANT
ncbi:SdpI family protein [uncultured Ruminococcus sp.]|uniref:SdpI family protein n=1 Tax=uncultured Ruminococcus sp. TaxID=165186 RepID=UPI0025D07DD0|nr:SdpI family protein [uncultured Ruminococcus sp.]